MNLTEKDHDAVVRAFLEFLSQVMRSSPSEPPDKPHGCNRVVELHDAGCTFHLHATFTPRPALLNAHEFLPDGPDAEAICRHCGTRHP